MLEGYRGGATSSQRNHTGGSRRQVAVVFGLIAAILLVWGIVEALA